MNYRPEPGGDPNSRENSRLVDPEAYDASEQEFAASLEKSGEDSDEIRSVSEDLSAATAAAQSAALAQEESPDAWRQELASRLDRYRARRRPREPRYPSLRLNFESTPPAPVMTLGMPRTALAIETTMPVPAKPYAGPMRDDPAENVARVIPFPRSALAPPPPLEELAEPVIDFPRILEVPEVEPPVPALGGILIEPVDGPAPERRPGIEVPLRSAPLWRRFLAAGVDGLLVLAAVALFGWIFFRITVTIPGRLQMAGMVACFAAIFWIAYQYLMVVRTGGTLGLKAARLRLSRFDGRAVPRKARRWRVLASILSAVSLGLGYAWCILDEDELCWHDRITATYLAPR